MEQYTYAQYEASAQALRQRLGDFRPRVLLILGSGLGYLGDQVENPIAVDYKDIPNFKASTAPGHKGRLVFGTLEGQKVAVMQGRMHHYEGYSYEEVKDSILPMARDGAEPTSAMGVDTPLAVLSEHHQPLFNYFKQLFAQVTNPPMDAIREEIVTDTTVYVGAGGNLLQEKAENCTVLQIHNPILTSVDLMKLRYMNKPGFHVETISLLYYKSMPLEHAIDRLFVNVDRAYKDGANILILSDRGVDENHVAIPSLLAVSALEQYLVRTKKRTAVSMILESAEPRDVHHFATLLGYGAQAINPYLAQECVEELITVGLLDKDPSAAVDDYNSAILHGIVKIASKMGISTIQSYQSAQIFECVGINKDVVDKYFTNTISRVGGVGLEEIGEGVEWNHNQAFDPLGLGYDTTLDSTGTYKLRSGSDKEDHMYNPRTILLLQKAAREGSYETFKEYTALVDFADKPHTLRGLLDFRFDENGGIPIDEVEPVSSIVKRFKTGAMSYGSISQEAHECMAIAMNRIGGKSNSGEGGEARDRLHDERCSAIKQVASGRFGVHEQYLDAGAAIEIKMGQGAKPGIGGHLPGAKIVGDVSKTRMIPEGADAISPAPHHDIYSIEDLRQLVYSLKEATQYKKPIIVKVAAVHNIAAIASGIARSGADIIAIDGFRGGTGAAPTRIRDNVGIPVELALAAVDQRLRDEGIRNNVSLIVGGSIRSSADVVKATALGADACYIATAALLAMGCHLCRSCQTGRCCWGIATQRPDLVKRLDPQQGAERLVNLVTAWKHEIKEMMGGMGINSIEALRGNRVMLRGIHLTDKELEILGVAHAGE